MEKLTVRPCEAAQMLSVSERKLFDMIKHHGFPRIKCGRTVLISVEDIKKWLTNGGNDGITK